MKKIISIVLIIGFVFIANAQKTTYELKENVHYYSDSINKTDKYIQERCVLDVYYPKDIKNYATIVWFHGGGLTAGEKAIPEALKDKGVGVVAVNYRLYPKVKAPTYIDSLGGDSSLVFISGHSAGGYLASMVGLDKSWLAKYGSNANKIAGLIPFSGHTITHFTVRKKRGISGTQPIVDELAPLYHVRANAPPLLLITGDRELEMLGRYEENAYLMRMMKVVGHKETELYELEGYGHGMTEPAFPLLLNEVNRLTKKKKKA
jgi:acetyl esterase/lipase